MLFIRLSQLNLHETKSLFVGFDLSTNINDGIGIFTGNKIYAITSSNIGLICVIRYKVYPVWWPQSSALGVPWTFWERPSCRDLCPSSHNWKQTPTTTTSTLIYITTTLPTILSNSLFLWMFSISGNFRFCCLQIVLYFIKFIIIVFDQFFNSSSILIQNSLLITRNDTSNIPIYNLQFNDFNFLHNSIKLSTTHAKAITTKSSQFHASLRYVNGCSMKPLAITFTADSNV